MLTNRSPATVTLTHTLLMNISPVRVHVMQHEEAFPEYQPGTFASVARFSRRRFGATSASGVLELFERRVTFTNSKAQLLLDAAVDEMFKLKAHKYAFEFEYNSRRWTVAFINRGGMGDQQLPPRLPRDITGPHDLPLFRLDGDTASMEDLCARWVAELRG